MSEFSEEVQDRLFSFARIARNSKEGKWAAWVDPEMLQGFDMEPVPPGQLIVLDPPDNVAFDGGRWSAAREKWYRTAQDIADGKWAVLPWFETQESAQKMIMRWLNAHRPDIVKACEEETRKAIAWRNGNKAIV